jgi:hypothetical protein
MNYIKKYLISVLKNDLYNRDLHGIGLMVGMGIKNFIKDDVEGFSKSDFLKGINEGLSKSDEEISKGE